MKWFREIKNAECVEKNNQKYVDIGIKRQLIRIKKVRRRIKILESALRASFPFLRLDADQSSYLVLLRRTLAYIRITLLPNVPQSVLLDLTKRCNNPCLVSYSKVR